MAPLDLLLGILAERYSTGVREMACRLSLNEAFVPACENLARMASGNHEVLGRMMRREARKIRIDLAEVK